MKQFILKLATSIFLSSLFISCGGNLPEEDYDLQPVRSTVKKDSLTITIDSKPAEDSLQAKLRSLEEENRKLKARVVTLEKNTYWDTCKYKDVIKQILEVKLEIDLNNNSTKDFLNERFYALYSPEHTDIRILMFYEERVSEFINSMIRGTDIKYLNVKSDSLPIVFMKQS